MLAFSGIRYHYNRYSEGQIEGCSLQLVQVVQRRGDERWIERTDLVSDDHERIFWAQLRARGSFSGSGRITCEWVRHPGQLHRFIREQDGGGINPFRARFQVAHPLRFHSAHGNFIDEVAHYRHYRERPATPQAADGLTILLVGELAYNADRVLALEERGHRLYGLWTSSPAWFKTVGPLPFGHVIDLPRDDWQHAVQRIQPDVIYAQLNWQTVAFCHTVLRANPGIPLVFHFKEGPFICYEQGLWPTLVRVLRRSAAQIFISAENRAWFRLALGEMLDPARSFILDGDLPKVDWFDESWAPKLSEHDGQIHTVVTGRPLGLAPFSAIAAAGINVHLYGEQFQQTVPNLLREGLPSEFLHLHPAVEPAMWVRELLRYDAAWLHLYTSDNGGDVRRARWDDLNLPARLGNYVAAGLPWIMRDNGDVLVATQRLATELGVGLCFNDWYDLAAQLRDRQLLLAKTATMRGARMQFAFDNHVDALIAILRQARA
ncbi:glycosyltransferase family 2 protein [Candidatus Gracilibacteria bacterium]|nr:glycosyltransferase family 2 protein [Candidatus Gracilibacteria bacterium]